MNYQLDLQQFLPFINEWITSQSREVKQTQNFKELEIHFNNNFIEHSFFCIQHLLKPFQHSLPLNVKRMLKISTLNPSIIFIVSKYFNSIEDFIHLEMSTRKFKGNIDLFKYNPIPLTNEIRDFFPNLETLYIYSPNEIVFRKDKRIIKRKKQFIPYYLNDKQKRQMEEWTGLKCGEIIFDSDQDDWEEITSEFNHKILGKRQLMFVVEDSKGEKFGYYSNMFMLDYSNEIIYPTDEKSFHFNIESNGRLSRMMKFPVKNKLHGYCLFDDDEEVLIVLGDMCLFKQNFCFNSCFLNHNTYEYYGIPNALCGKTKGFDYSIELKRTTFIPTRIFVIQMEMKEERKHALIKHKEEQEIKQFEQLTGLKFDEVIFDSTKDDWSINRSNFEDKIKGRKQILFVINDSNGEKFGYYLNSFIIDDSVIRKHIPTNDKSYEFNLQSNGRFKETMKFPIVNKRKGYSLFDEDDKRLITIGNIYLYKENYQHLSFCLNNEKNYDYQGISNAICGKTRFRKENGEWTGEYFTPIRIRVIQMK